MTNGIRFRLVDRRGSYLLDTINMIGFLSIVATERLRLVISCGLLYSWNKRNAA